MSVFKSAGRFAGLALLFWLAFEPAAGAGACSGGATGARPAGQRRRFVMDEVATAAARRASRASREAHAGHRRDAARSVAQ